jgi:hypothetical protein
MNFHRNNKDNQGSHNHSPLKHMLHMVLCCGLPIVVLAALPLITRFSTGAGSAISKIVPFICPIMMVGMMAMMFGNNKKSSCCDKTNDDNKSLELNKTIE